ncbi:structural maintenance of chromosomes 1 protein (ISS) [Tropilaelaps mercedesae]|uniref:Structural maintenance of chromosomes 1 protein (ISS) n=1 Tax=Tropilaelaps mercedesae TaxID=418985 RepID=A0A1V9WY65_9ACAR|nr:structural maintenance of chromosomes 1 protein (ISS) [Tropilaelaps mercedesae]
MEPPERIQIASMQIEHFRSFDNVYEVRFCSRVTAVVGPNWSGKSNILSALIFGLGRTPEEMCVDDVRSLINDNYARKCRETGQEAYCAVTVLIEGDGRTVPFTRYLYENKHEIYQIDQERCDVAKFRERVTGYGIDVDSWGLVLRQGSIANMVGSTPRSMSMLIEKLSGSHQLTESVNEAEGHLRETLTELVNAKAEFRHLVLEARKMKSYSKTEELRAESIKKEKMLGLAKVWQADEKIRICQNEIENIPEDEEEKARLQALKEERHSVYELLQNCTKKVVCYETSVATARDELRISNRKKQETSVQHSEADERLKTLTARKLKINDCIRETKEKLQDAEAKLPVAKEKVDMSRSALEPVQVNADVLIQLWNLEDQFKKGNPAAFTKAESLEEVRWAFTDAFENLSAEVKFRETKAQLIKDELQTLKQRRDVFERQLDTLDTDIRPVRIRLEELKAMFDKACKEHALQVTKVCELNMQRRLVKAQSERKIRLRETEQVLDRLTALFGSSRVLGVISNLVSPCKPAYAAAVRQVLGPYMQAVVVDSRNTLKECVAYLKTSQEPSIQMLVLPLTAPAYRPLPKTAEGRVALFSSICLVSPSLPLHIQDRIWHLIADLCSDVLFCDDVSSIKMIATSKGHRFSVVMSDGSFLSKNGVFEICPQVMRSSSTDSTAEDVLEQLSMAKAELRETESILGRITELHHLKQKYMSMKQQHRDAQSRLELLTKEVSKQN